MRLPLIFFMLFAAPSATARPHPTYELAQTALLALLGPKLDVAAPKAPPSWERGRRAVVEVLVDDHLNGTGFIVSPGGYVLTAAHVVQQLGRRVEARTVHGRVSAEVIALDLGHDLGLLKLQPSDKGTWPMVSLAQHSPPPGADLFLLGTPIYRHHVLFKGMMARAEPTYEYLPDEQRYVRILHVSGMSPAGTSGGPWMQADGDVVGVQIGLMHSRGSHVGVAYLAPIEAMRALIRRAEHARTPSLGIAVEEIWEQPDHFLQQFPAGTEGLVVSVLLPNGPGAGAGLRGDDVITHADGRKITLRDELIGYVRGHTVGETINLTVLHAGEAPRLVPVQLDALEARLLRSATSSH